jgi:hypothetical protein
MPRPVHFEIHATDPSVLRTFYEEVFGWTFQKWAGADYWVITTGDEPDGVNGGLTSRSGASAAPDGINAYVAVIGVGDCQHYFDRAVAAGAAGITMPPTVMPGVGVLAYLKDPDGNLFGIIEPEPGSG